MCGIAGFIDTKRQTKETGLHATVDAMTERLINRGPDSGDVWVNPEQGVAFGHRRLAIIDLTDHGKQPMASDGDRWMITFNGEIYNFEEIRDTLKKLGHAFHGNSDTEVMLAAVKEWGLEAAVERFIGMFAFALWDTQDRTLHLGRDRMGIKPLYWGIFGDHLMFASELKAFTAHPEFVAEIDRPALATFLRRSNVPAPQSIYTGVSKLPAGSILTQKADGTPPTIAAFWSMKSLAEDGARNPFQGSMEDAVGELEPLLRTSVRQRMISDVPLGSFLSGGLDSSTVTALAQAESAKPVQTFTVGFEDPDFNEADHAKAVAAHLGTDHTEVYVSDQELRDVLPKLPTMYDEPFADSSQIPTFLVSQMARQHVTVCLSGDGGDEMFGGYNRYTWLARINGRLGALPRSARSTLAGMVRGLSPAGWDRLFALASPILPKRYAHADAGERMHKMAGLFSAQGIGAMHQRTLTVWDRPPVPGAQEIPDILADPATWPTLDDPVRRMMAVDVMTYLVDDLLTKVDRASMAVALEVRVPLIDHRVAAFASTLPKHMLFGEGGGKAILRQILYRHVPQALVDRPKWGFSVPLQHWLRGPLRDWAEDLLNASEMTSAGYLDPAPISACWAEHLSGRFNHQAKLWPVLMFQSWLQANSPGP
ncbi:MAG: asparagine synthase (glutamine-hydrolyzing) [Alphaproteobacteria bacterium]|jgi:asparagine synthase (glutamine-hydrolysing)|nr:asparagine synthase (glutamine-hydrolyzing) [Alphaproteobacteria bacterium]